MKKLAIIITHPIQYYTPIFKLLAKNTDVMVFYTWGESSIKKHDPGFNQIVEWDIPLLEGYNYTWVKNTAIDPGSHHFKGIINPDLIDQVKQWQPDALLIFGWAYKSHLSIMRYFKNKIRVLFRGDSTLLDEKPGLKSLFKAVYLKWIYRHIDYALYTGLNNKAYFEKYGLKALQLSYAPHAIDNERFGVPRSAEVLTLRKSLDIKAEDILILFAGKLEEKKAPDLLLNAFLKLDLLNTHLVFTGSGYLKSMLQQKAGENKRVHFIDFKNQSDMPVIYQSCDLFCLPSKGPGESWGLAVNEAMACGKAILVSDKVGCAADLVKPGYNGLIFKSGDLNDLLQCLKELTASKELLTQYGQNSTAFINSWSFEAIVKTVTNILIHETY
jgi:glycosyltransferase involved in cell wall biosynthesis